MSINYRGEIDGLRAIAVLLVIFSHLKFNYLSGGFVGVDIFFVISGFLITSNIKQSIEDKSFSFGDFYRKRIVRLAPAYFLVLFATTLTMLFIATPNELIDYTKSVLYSSVFAANFYLFKSIGGYFNVSAETTPLLHLWSLGIEEQFYIFWPVALILLSYLKFKLRLIVIILAIIIGVIISQKAILFSASLAYFLLPFRAFELLIGAALAFTPTKNLALVWRNFFGLAGLLLIFIPAIIFSEKTVFPGYSALLPCIGTALVIYFCRSGLLQTALTTKPMQFFGKISYPAYLWHWPLIAVLNILYIEINFILGIAVFAITIFLAWLTYKYIEQPFSKYRNSGTMPVVLKGYVLPLCFVFAFGAFIFAYSGLPARFDHKAVVMEEAIPGKNNLIRRVCMSGNPEKVVYREKCKIGVNKPTPDFLLVGDSHANHFAPMLDVFAKDAKLGGYEITQTSTLFLPDVDRFSMKTGEEKIEHKFKIRNDALVKHLKQHKYKFVILGGSYAESYTASIFKNNNGKSDRSVFLTSVESSIDLITSTGATPILIKGAPRLNKYDPSCPLKKHIYSLRVNCNTEKFIHDQIFKNWNEDMEVLLKKYPDLIVIDPTLVVCSAKECFAELKGVPLYKDLGHLNHAASLLIGEVYLEMYGNPFLK